MEVTITPYQRSVLLALANTPGGVDNVAGIAAYLQSAGWAGFHLVPERVEIALEELKEKGLVAGLRD